MITIENLTKTFKVKNREVKAVQNINLEIADGEIFGVIGYSGAGKSTFIRLLNRLEEPTSGKVIIDERNITTLRGKELRMALQNIGMVFQHFNLLWSRTVADNIAFPLEVAGVPKGERQKRVEELVHLVGLSHRIDAYPSELSGGEKQRVGIARALANDPKVLLCDEATSALDPETTNSILDLLVTINEKLNLTIVLITHEMHVIQKICNRVAVMESGKIVEQGDVLDVFSRPQENVTKKFIKQIMGELEEEQYSEILSESIKGQIVKFHFVGDETESALISQMVKKFDIDISILQGKVTQTKKGPYGSLVVAIDGEVNKIQKALDYIKDETSVEVEVIRHD